jgi:hypothetical protein
VLGMSCTLSAFVIIFVAVKDATGSSVSAYTTHRNLGIAAMSMGLFQVTALVLRWGAGRQEGCGSKRRGDGDAAHVCVCVCV